LPPQRHVGSARAGQLAPSAGRGWRRTPTRQRHRSAAAQRPGHRQRIPFGDRGPETVPFEPVLAEQAGVGAGV